MDVTYIATNELRSMAAPYNPRQISDHDLMALGRSMTTFGVVEPIVVNRRTNRIVGGHQRVKAAEGAGVEQLPVGIFVVTLEVLQQSSTPTHHPQESLTRVMVLLVCLKVTRQLIDPIGQPDDLDLGGPGVCLVKAELLQRRFGGRGRIHRRSEAVYAVS